MRFAINDKPALELKTVVFATDFSPCSRNAGHYAARMAAYFSAQLLVTHAFSPTQAAMEVEIGDQKVSRQRLELTSLLSKEALLVGADFIDAVPALLEGDPKFVIPTLADQSQPSMIVLGTHGGNRLKRGIIGSVAEKILRSTSGPTLTVGPQVQTLSSNTIPFKKILFATDFTPAAAGAALYAITLAGACGATIEVLNVIGEDALEDQERSSNLQSSFYSALGGLVPQQPTKFSPPKTFVAVGNAQDRILETIRQQSIDLLVLSIRKHSHLDVEMRTSGVFRIIVHAECPVLTIRR